MEDFTPPEKLEVKAMGNGRTHFVKEEKYLNYVDIKSRFIGLLFRYKKNQYLYRHPNGFEGIKGENLELLEKRHLLYVVVIQLVVTKIVVVENLDYHGP